jgi:uncharacterized protein (DUF488 family)
MRGADATRGIIYTAGYEGKNVDEFMRGLAASGVRQILDVRRNAISRKRGFSKSALSVAAQSHGLSYVHMRSLGVPSAMRRELRSREDYDALLTEYERRLLPAARHSVESAAQLVREQPTALLCFESDHTMCHRAPLSLTLADITGYHVTHL